MATPTKRLAILLLAVSPAALAQLPGWLELAAEARGRGEAFTGIDFRAGNDNSYYLSRLRLDVTVRPRPWLRFSATGQDSEAPGYREPAPSSIRRGAQLYRVFADAGHEKRGWNLRIGRQDLVYGEERLVGAGNWGNVGRVFDAAKLTWRGDGVALDWFTASAVVPRRGWFDRPRWNNKLHGFYSAFGRWIPGTSVEPYFFWKTVSRGDLDVLTLGLRAAGKGRRVDYGVEMAVQRGEQGEAAAGAWAGHWLAGYAAARRLRLFAECNIASGKFDQLYPTNHNKYGIADRFGWRNIRELAGGVEIKLWRAWTFQADAHVFHLASRADFLYNEAGQPVTRNPLASSSHVGDEVDLQARWEVHRHLDLRFGVAHLWPGRYLKESTPASPGTTAYGMFTVRF